MDEKVKKLLIQMQRVEDVNNQLMNRLKESSSLLQVMHEKEKEIMEKEKEAKENLKFGEELEAHVQRTLSIQEAEYDEKWSQLDKERERVRADRADLIEKEKDLDAWKADLMECEGRIHKEQIILTICFILAWLQSGILKDFLQIGSGVGSVFRIGQKLVHFFEIQSGVLIFIMDWMLPVGMVIGLLFLVGYGAYCCWDYLDQKSLSVVYMAGYVAILTRDFISGINSVLLFVGLLIGYFAVRIYRDRC